MVEFDDNGNPLVSFSSGKIIAFVNEDSQPVISSNGEIEPVLIGKTKVIPWYDDNDFPQTAHLTIKQTPVLNRALSDLTKVELGQGLFPCEVIDTLDDGREVVQVIKDPEVNKYLQSYVTRRYLVKTAYNKNSMGNAFVQFIPNKPGDKILNLNPVNSLHCRLEMYDNNGIINNVVVSGKWPDVTEKDTKKYLLLDEIDPMGHLLKLKEEKALAKQTVFMHIQNSFDSNDFYSLPSWYSSQAWITITNKVPKIINSGMDNVLNIFFVIKIPRSYWDWKYPPGEFDSEKERKDKIAADFQKIEEKFTTVDNARKALVTLFGISEDGIEDKWDIQILEHKFNQENFVTSSAADTQIAIAAGFSPDLLGLMYGNSKGGSMQRELLLLQYALSWEARQQLADPIEMMLKFNNPSLENMVLRFRNTFLTTLDTGAGTAQTLS